MPTTKKDKESIQASKYYFDELEKLDVTNLNGLSIKLTDYLGNNTKWLNLNIESIEEVVYYLNTLKKDIIKNNQ